MSDRDRPTPSVLLDLDGTLVDSVYLHVVTWEEAFRTHGYEVPMHRIHVAIGMGSDRLVPFCLGFHPDDAAALADAHTARFLERSDALRPTDGARGLITDLETRGVPFLIATSAGTEEREALLAALGREDLATTDSGDAGDSKPAPDLLLTACERLGVEPAETTLIGDSPWDAVAARRVGIGSIAVRCGGFGDQRLREGGAMQIVDAPRDLIGRL